MCKRKVYIKGFLCVNEAWKGILVCVSNENEEEEEGVEEVLVIDVEYDSTDGVRFDVIINDQGDNEIGPQDSEFAGSFVTLPHSPHVNHNNITKASFRLGSNKRR